VLSFVQPFALCALKLRHSKPGNPPGFDRLRGWHWFRSRSVLQLAAWQFSPPGKMFVIQNQVHKYIGSGWRFSGFEILFLSCLTS
jgi:hypothetical protein